MAREPLCPVSFPYQDYWFESSKTPKRGSCQSSSAQSSAVAVPEYNLTASRGRGNLSGEAHRGAPRVSQQPYQQPRDGAHGNCPWQPNPDWDGAHGNHPQQPNQDWEGAHGNHPWQPNRDWDGAHGNHPQWPN